jgi:hypothetical protein
MRQPSTPHRGYGSFAHRGTGMVEAYSAAGGSTDDVVV